MKPQIIKCDQGSEQWYAARLGIPTASEFATVMRRKGKAEDGSSKERTTYLRKLAGERLTGEPMESYTNAFMDRGKLLEDEARSFYAFMADAELERVGFIRLGDAGCSPDSLIGADGGLEIKVALPHIQIERLERDELPAEHKAQVQGSLWISGRQWWDFVSYAPKLPLFVKRVARDEDYIRNIAESVGQFNADLDRLVGWLRGYGRKAA